MIISLSYARKEDWLEAGSTAARLGLEDKQGRFHAALLGEDELGIVIRAHIHIEHEVIAYINARLSPPGAIDALNLNYARQVKLALGLGLSAEFKFALRSLGTPRNKFAHRLDAKLDEQEASNLERALGPAIAISRQAYQTTQSALQADEKAMPLSTLEPRDRVILCLVTLWGGVPSPP